MKESQDNVDTNRGHYNAQHSKDADAYPQHRSDLVYAKSEGVLPKNPKLIKFKDLQKPDSSTELLCAETPARCQSVHTPYLQQEAEVALVVCLSQDEM